MKGQLSFILHAHLPFVRHPEYQDFLEERWLYEALTETYIPLIHVFEGLERDHVPFRITMTLTPSLLCMLQDGLLQERYSRHVRKLIELTERELERTAGDPALHRLAGMYNQRFELCRHTFEERYGRDLTTAFKGFQDRGGLEIITCAATHAFLPMLSGYPNSVRAQLRAAADHYRRSFGRNPSGIWLPECAYYKGLEALVAEQEIRYFILENNGILMAEPPPVYGLYAPVFTPAGVAAFGRDVESSKQVWSSKEGYPGDVRYRDFYRDVGFDLDFDYIKPYINPDGIRIHTGVKYYAITSADLGDKRPYDPHAAYEAAVMHAGNFQFNRERQVEYLLTVMDREPIIVCPYDAELFGHWWFEGPLWLDLVIRKLSCDAQRLRLSTPLDYLERQPTNQMAWPNPSSWGAKSSYEVWLNHGNAWIYPHVHAASERMAMLADRFREPGDMQRRALNQAAREVLLLQSSDWPFIMTTGTAVDYAVKRIKVHTARFTRLRDMLLNDTIDDAYLRAVEERDTIFPELDFRVFAT
ncbi:DUF1957 domain-containing protein [bacterium]|nr:DUF1957 domain-containing protein [candidate division CSSED10-310 bacterium]